MRRRAHIAAGAAFFVALSAMLAGPALALVNPTVPPPTLPVVTIGTAQLIDPGAAESYYTSHNTAALRPATALNLPPAPEIVELARGLKGNVDLIYEYVRNNIENVWMYGSYKGALGTMLDKSGTDFDQAILMVALLQQSGIDSAVVAGTLDLSTGQDFTDWSGIADAKAACQLLSSGGIPAVVNSTASPNCTFSAGTPISHITMSHAWVKVNIAGTSYYFDPSFKRHVWKTPIDLALATQYQAGNPLTQASGGMSTGTDVHGAHYASHLDATDLNAALNGYAGNLISYLESQNLVGAHMEDIIGGGVIIPYASPQGGLRQTTLPGGTKLHDWLWSTAPVDRAYRATLRISGTMWSYPFDRNDTMFDTTVFSDEVYGRSLIVDTDYDSHILHQSQYWDATITLKLDGQPFPGVSTYTNPSLPWDPHPTARGAPTTMSLAADHPYAASSGAYMDNAITKLVVLITPLTIVASWGDTGEKQLTRLSSRHGANKQAPYLLNAPHGCPGDDICQNFFPGSVGDISRAKTAASWLAQYTEAAHMNAELANSVVQLHHALGFVYGDAVLDPQYGNILGDPDWVLADNFDRLDIDSAFSVTSRVADATKRRGALHAIAAAASALEGGMGAQMGDAPDTSSTATRFEWGNKPPATEDPSGAAPRTFYQFNSGNWSTAESSATLKAENTTQGTEYYLLNLSQQPLLNQADTDNYIAMLSGEIKRFTDLGFEVVASQESFLGPGQRGGKINFAKDQNGNNIGYGFDDTKQRGGAFVATKYDPTTGDPVAIAHIVTALSLLLSLDGSAAVTKGGGAGAQPDAMTNYSPSEPADVTKSRFKDKSSELGVNLANGSVAPVTPATLTVGKGDVPYSLSASLSFVTAPHPVEPGAPLIPTQPNGGWEQSWQNNLSLSGSGLEAMGQSDPRAAAGAIVAFMAAQDIFANNAPSPQRDAAAVLALAWWTHQMSGNVATVALGTASQQFVKLATGTWTATGGGRYAKLVQTGTRVAYEYKCFFDPPPYAMSRGWDITGVSFHVYDAAGNDELFDNWTNNYTSSGNHACAQARGFRLKTLTYASGIKDTLEYGSPSDPFGIGQPGVGIESLLDVKNSLGRQINFYANGHLFDNNMSGADARAITTTSDSTSMSFTDPANATTKLVFSPAVAASFTTNILPLRPFQMFYADKPTLPAIEYDYDTLGHVQQIRDGINLQVGDDTVAGGRDPTTFYFADGTRGERDDPAGGAYTVVYDTYGHASRFIDELGRETDQLADGRGRVLSTTYPEFDQETFTYDVRNNPLTRVLIPKPGSAEANSGKILTVRATYKEAATVATCVSVKTCNKPATTVSANNWTTNYTWNTNGTLQKVLLPADNANHRPETDYGYATFGADGFTLLTSRTELATPTTSKITAYDYDSTNYYMPKTVTVDPNGFNLATTLTYDHQGDVTKVKGPRTDYDTSAYFTYDNDRRNILAIQPDPDSSGTNHPRPASKKTYDPAGHLTEMDRGTTTTTTGSDFAINNWVKVVYDPDDDKALETAGYGATTSTVTQFAYDGAHRLLCTARRMNPTQYTALPADACALGSAGSFGPDRIVKMVYDPGGQVLQELRAFGTPIQQTYATHTYTQNGKEASVFDADGASHITTYSYDGFDRLKNTTFADGTYLQNYIYDNDGNIKKVRNRAGEYITFTFDRLDRMLTKLVPASGSIPANTISWVYDMIGEVTSLSDTNGNVLANEYDLTGRQVTASQTLPGMTGGAKTVSYAYDDGAGDKVNRSRITWPDGYYVNYGYDAMNNMTTAVDSDSAALATRTYDDLARPATTQYPSITDNIAYSWDSEDNLATLTNGFWGTANDVSFTNSFTPAHQIKGSTISNTLYKFNPPASGTDIYPAVNNLNQYTSVTPAGLPSQAISYDLRGNLTFDGVLTLAYDPENRLMTASKTGMSASYRYDPLGRRTAKTVGMTVTNFLHDGDTEIGEYDADGNVQRRFIPGPAIDQPIAMVTVSSGVKTMFHTDKLGSVVAMSNATDGHRTTGAGPYVYDTYGNCVSSGNPCSTAGTPYLYTGQRLDPETGLYYYRARYYSSTLGRMMQTDSAGYGDDIDWYNYAQEDPTDKTDPSGNTTSFMFIREPGSRDYTGGATYGDWRTYTSYQHSAVYVSRGGLGGTPLIYEPGGDFYANEGRGSNGVLMGDSASGENMASMENYVRRQLYVVGAKWVEVVTFNTTAAQEKQIGDLAMASSDDTPMDCTTDISALIGQVGGFEDVGETMWPGHLYQEVKHRKGAKEVRRTKKNTPANPASQPKNGTQKHADNRSLGIDWGYVTGIRCTGRIDCPGR